MGTLDSMMRETVNRNLLRHAVGRAITCPRCDDILDATRAVLVTGPRAAWVGCAPCWGRSPFLWDAGDWSVLDGRVLFRILPRARRARRPRRSA